LTNGRELAHNANDQMTRLAFSVVVPHYSLAIGGELCPEAVA
jgi:hypothetical protein